jgi:hypothetical protein
VPDRPGLGVELDEATALAHPFREYWGGKTLVSEGWQASLPDAERRGHGEAAAPGQQSARWICVTSGESLETPWRLDDAHVDHLAPRAATATGGAGVGGMLWGRVYPAATFEREPPDPDRDRPAGLIPCVGRARLDAARAADYH